MKVTRFWENVQGRTSKISWSIGLGYDREGPEGEQTEGQPRSLREGYG